jgi:localization factor PodJL
VAEAISSIMQRLAEVEQHSAEAIAPVQKAVSNVASKLELFESAQESGGEGIPTPSRRFDDFPNFGEEPYVSPMDAAQPLRAAPLRQSSFDDGELVQRDAVEEDIYFAEDIEDLLAPEAPEDPAETASAEPYEFSSGDDDLLIEDAHDADEFETTPPPQDDDPFWTPETHAVDAFREETDTEDPLAPTWEEEQAQLARDDDPPPLDLDGAQSSPPPGKNDYLANARRAAMAQASLPKTRPEPGPTPKLGLRGSSRIVLWGAASLVALLMVGGVWYIRTQDGDASTTEPQQEPAAPPTAGDPNAPFEAPPQDPFAEAPVEGLAPDGADVEGAPIAQNEGAAEQVVAGPLAPRNISLEQAAQSGDLTAQYELALQRLAAGRTQEGVSLLRRAADRGFAMAQYRLAKLYERGEGVPTDLTQARQWTERAAASGNRRAMHDLGVYFARGEGAPLDEAAAFRWFRQAAELGVADSQYNLGVLYQQGRGVSANPAEALFWFSVAARQGDQDAGARATALEAQLTPMQVEQARARAQAFRPRAASAVANGEFGPRAWSGRTGT